MNPPRLLLLTDRRLSEAVGRRLSETVARAVEAGAPAVVLREKDLPRDVRRRLALDLLAVTEPMGCQLLIASDAALATDLGAAGVHLASDDPACLTGAWLVGRSCHHRADVLAARDAGLDYVTVSPMAVTASKPGYGPALGPAGLASLVEAAGPLPVLALGGVTAANAPSWIQVGAHGVAVMGGVMRAADPAASVRSLLEALRGARPDAPIGVRSDATGDATPHPPAAARPMETP